MKITLSKVLNIRPVRFLIVAFIGALLLFSNAFPTLAATSSPTKGEDQLKQVEERSEQVLKSNPRSMKEVQADTENGLNEVQGEANKNKMKNPMNTGNATSIEEILQDKLENVVE